MKLWEQKIKPEKFVEDFTTSTDKNIDLKLAPYDVIGSIAHAKMLHHAGIFSHSELKQLEYALHNILEQIRSGNFEIDEDVEDIHSQIEIILTQKIGNVGKKLHTGRSRNDQILLDLKLFFRDAFHQIINQITILFKTLIDLSNKHKDIFMPGYTHMQIAMPSSFGLWFGAFAESLTDDMQLLLTAYKINDQNPLGSAAGYGSSFPLNRTITTKLLGFNNLQVNSIYAQISRTKNEISIANALAATASTSAKLAMDICLYSSQNFGFFSIPEQFTTGSSIMPHKNNPDPFELIRAKCNKLLALPNEINLITSNLSTGYHRDYQLTKQNIIPAFEELEKSVSLLTLLLQNIEINISLKDDPLYNDVFSVEEVNKLVMKGMTFRDAYKKVTKDINSGQFKPDKKIKHTHEGSIGNLCNDKLESKMKNILSQFDFEKKQETIKKLLYEGQ